MTFKIVRNKYKHLQVSSSMCAHVSDEEGDMSASTRTISIEIDMQAQLVAMMRGEEWGAVERDGLPKDSIPPPPGQLGHNSVGV